MNRKQETVVVWIVTIGFLAALLTAFLLRHMPSFIGICIGYAAVLGTMMAMRRLGIPASQRHRDPCPWDRVTVARKAQISSVTALIPALQVTGSERGHQLWTVESEGGYGLWKLEIEERAGEILAYALTYRDSRTAALDTGESISVSNARFISTGAD